MSVSLYDDIGGLRFWSEEEIELRELFQKRAASVVQSTLLPMNKAWRFFRMEGPILTPRDRMSAAYTEEDIFLTNQDRAGKQLALRAETTASSYAYARHVGGYLPVCVWQAGKSFRTEKSDGATAAKLRFNEFWQQEFQCIYNVTTKADYRSALIASISHEIGRFTMLPVRQVESDRLPSYSESTLDIEVKTATGWREMASCSIRTDYADDARVCEIAIGLDRIASLAAI